MNPWICPKCGRVWGPGTMACIPCNMGMPITTFSDKTNIGGAECAPKPVEMLNSDPFPRVDQKEGK